MRQSLTGAAAKSDNAAVSKRDGRFSAALGELYEMVCRDERQSCSVSELHVGGQCGGSDGFSGLTANKLVGKCAEAIVSWGGTFNITEVTEMFGAEQILINRAIDAQTAEKINRLLQMHGITSENTMDLPMEIPPMVINRVGLQPLRTNLWGVFKRAADVLSPMSYSMVNGPGSMDCCWCRGRGAIWSAEQHRLRLAQRWRFLRRDAERRLHLRRLH